MLKVIICILLGSPLASALAEFFVPGPPPYPRWTVGDTQEIRYKTTYTEYTIALWQQFDDDDAAELGPILFQTSKGPGQNFDWLVQTYDFNLERSNKFFLWLYEGESSSQGNGTFENQSSGYFFISEASSTTTSSQPRPTATTSSLPSTTSQDAASTSSADQDDPDAAGDGLSTGAKAGIGAGAGVGALAIVSIIVFFLKYRSKKKKQIAELQSAGDSHWNAGDASWSHMSKTAFPDTHAAPLPSYELPGNGDYNRNRAELG